MSKCLLCRDSGWVEVEPQGSMRWMRPCRCEAGESGSRAVADFVNENPPDSVLDAESDEATG